MTKEGVDVGVELSLDSEIIRAITDQSTRVLLVIGPSGVGKSLTIKRCRDANRDLFESWQERRLKEVDFTDSDQVEELVGILEGRQQGRHILEGTEYEFEYVMKGFYKEEMGRKQSVAKALASIEKTTRSRANRLLESVGNVTGEEFTGRVRAVAGRFLELGLIGKETASKEIAVEQGRVLEHLLTEGDIDNVLRKVVTKDIGHSKKVAIVSLASFPVTVSKETVHTGDLKVVAIKYGLWSEDRLRDRVSKHHDDIHQLATMFGITLGNVAAEEAKKAAPAIVDAASGIIGFFVPGGFVILAASAVIGYLWERKRGSFERYVKAHEQWISIPEHTKRTLAERIDRKFHLPPHSSYDFLSEWLGSKKKTRELVENLEGIDLEKLRKIVEEYDGLREVVEQDHRKLIEHEHRISGIETVMAEWRPKVETIPILEADLHDLRGTVTSAATRLEEVKKIVEDQGVEELEGGGLREFYGVTAEPAKVERSVRLLGEDKVGKKQTSFHELASLIGNWDGEKWLYVITGDPGVGKSWFACTLLEDAIKTHELLGKGYNLRRISRAGGFRYSNFGGFSIFVLDDAKIDERDRIPEVLKAIASSHHAPGPVVLSINRIDWERYRTQAMGELNQEFAENLEKKTIVAELEKADKGSMERILDSLLSQYATDGWAFRFAGNAKGRLIDKANGLPVIIGLFLGMLRYERKNRVTDFEVDEVNGTPWAYVLDLVVRFYFRTRADDSSFGFEDGGNNVAHVLSALRFLADGKAPVGLFYLPVVSGSKTEYATVSELFDRRLGRSCSFLEKLGFPLFTVTQYGIIRPIHDVVRTAITSLAETGAADLGGGRLADLPAPTKEFLVRLTQYSRQNAAFRKAITDDLGRLAKDVRTVVRRYRDLMADLPNTGRAVEPLFAFNYLSFFFWYRTKQIMGGLTSLLKSLCRLHDPDEILYPQEHFILKRYLPVDSTHRSNPEEAIAWYEKFLRSEKYHWLDLGVFPREKYWLKQWDQGRIFEANQIKGMKKIFVSFPFPYMVGPLHVGHSFTLTRVDIYARFKRMRGYNVLFPWAWDWTGETIERRSKRLAHVDPEVRRTIRKELIEEDCVPKEEVEKFADPRYLESYFTRTSREAVHDTGFSVDWRREFRTVDPAFKKFIEWQYLRLRELGYVIKGTLPAVWCPNDHTLIEKHDRLEGENVRVEEISLVKFDIGGKWLLAGTLRPETIFGATNIWVNPEGVYCEVILHGEECIISFSAAQRLGEQQQNVNIIRKYQGVELLGKSVKAPITGATLPILPAAFVDAETATGVVLSVPAHAPHDYMGLKELQSGTLRTSKKIRDAANKIRPLPVISVPGYSEVPAEDVIGKMRIKDTSDFRLEYATDELHKAELHHGRMKENCNGFGGMNVGAARYKIVEEMKRKGQLTTMLDLPSKVICQCGERCYVKILDDLWFLNYSDGRWKERTRALIRQATILPRESTEQYLSTIDRLENRLFAKRVGMGTPLPWDKEWIIDIFSDSTIYTCFSTISHKISGQRAKPEQLTPEVFDFVFFGKGSAADVANTSGIDAELLDSMRSEFLYWYPVDLRQSAKELIPNHLTFFAFHHAALFEQNNWPKCFSVNGMIHFGDFPADRGPKGIFQNWKQLVDKCGADGFRATLALRAGGMDDTNWSVNSDRSLYEAEAMQSKLNSLIPFVRESLSESAKREPNLLDRWLISMMNRRISTVTSALEEMGIRKAIAVALLEVWADIRWYVRRTEKTRQETLKAVFDAWARLLAPFIPFIAEELNRRMGNEGLISAAGWPASEDFKVDTVAELSELLVMKVIEDVRNLPRLIREGKNVLSIYVSSNPTRDKFVEIARMANKKNAGAEVARRYGIVGAELERIIKLQRELGEERLAELVSTSNFDEFVILNNAAPFLSRETGLLVRVFEADSKGVHDPANRAKGALPFKPAFYLE